MIVILRDVKTAAAALHRGVLPLFSAKQPCRFALHSSVDYLLIANYSLSSRMFIISMALFMMLVPGPKIAATPAL